MVDERGPDDVARFLGLHGIEVQVLADDTSTSVAAAAALETSVGSIAKSLLFIAGEAPVLVLASGDTRVDGARLAHVLGAPSVRLAKPREVLEITGYRVGGVPPVVHVTPLRVVMDRALLTYGIVYAAAGSPLAIFPTTPGRLAELANAEVVDVTER